MPERKSERKGKPEREAEVPPALKIRKPIEPMLPPAAEGKPAIPEVPPAAKEPKRPERALPPAAEKPTSTPPSIPPAPVEPASSGDLWSTNPIDETDDLPEFVERDRAEPSRSSRRRASKRKKAKASELEKTRREREDARPVVEPAAEATPLESKPREEVAPNEAERRDAMPRGEDLRSVWAGSASEPKKPAEPAKRTEDPWLRGRVEDPAINPYLPPEAHVEPPSEDELPKAGQARKKLTGAVTGVGRGAGKVASGAKDKVTGASKGAFKKMRNLVTDLRKPSPKQQLDRDEIQQRLDDYLGPKDRVRRRR